MSLALNEYNETEYWLLLLRDTDYINEDTCRKLLKLNQELLKMLVSTINTMKAKSK